MLFSLLAVVFWLFQVNFYYISFNMGEYIYIRTKDTLILQLFSSLPNSFFLLKIDHLHVVLLPSTDLCHLIEHK